MGERQKELLKCIVESYIKNVKPVGSKSLCKKFNCSSATIRNDMMYLEELGYLEKTHISSGRIPSEAGYKYYVDNLMKPKEITGEDVLKLQTILNNKDLVLSDAINKCMEIISEITNYTSIVLGKSCSNNILKQISIIPIDDKKVVAVLVTNTGHVENKQVLIPTDISVKEILNTLKKANYPYLTNLPGYSYLFQLFVDDKEILEFDYGSIYTEDDSIMIIFTENDKEILNNYISIN